MKKTALLILGLFIFVGCGQTVLKTGQNVDLTGRVTRNNYEHVIDPPAGYPYAAYVRIDIGEIVLYAKDPIKCKFGQDVKFQGRVRNVEGEPVGGGEKTSEKHVVVKSWECIGEVDSGNATGTEIFEIVAKFPTKTVYTTNLTDQAVYKADCSKRAGTFNACGTQCEEDADFCSTVCAYTCEFPN